MKRKTMDDVQLKTILQEQREEYQRYLGIVTEDFKSSMKLIAESISDLQKQLVSLREMVAKNTEDIEIIKMDVSFIKNGLKRKVDLEEFTALEKRVALLEKRK
jgi:dynactin complex subunit